MNPPPSSLSSWCRLGALVVIAFVLAMVVLRWDRRTGFTSLIRFGELQVARQLPELRNLPIAVVPGEGYDGEYYAQFAVAPDLRRPEVRVALITPAYRARRVLLPVIAHVAGLGRPWPVLQVYALLNVVAWLAFAWVWWRETPPDDPAGLARWGAATLALGTLDSARLALTDLPCTLLLVLTVRAAQRLRPHTAALCLALAALTRETAALGLFAVRARSQPDAQPTSSARGWLLRAAAGSGLDKFALSHLFPEPTNRRRSDPIRSAAEVFLF